MTRISEVIEYLEQLAPPAYQESYDNSGLICGDASSVCSGILVCLDSLESVIDEAVSLGCNLVVAHHPILFSGLKKINKSTYIGRVLLKAIKNDVAIYAIHTNLDNVRKGVNAKMAEKLGLTSPRILIPKSGVLSKLVLYGKAADVERMRDAVFARGGGEIGNYSECSFVAEGKGSFKPGLAANPSLGETGKRQIEDEQRCEILVPRYLADGLIKAAREASSYEELAFDLIPLDNKNQDLGSGMIGELAEAMELQDFLARVKEVFGAKGIRYTATIGRKIKRVALCGGSGSFCLPDAIKQGADVLLTADFKYHQFFDADGKVIIVDIGHYESEQYTSELLVDYLNEKFTTFAVRLTSIVTNPIHYY